MKEKSSWISKYDKELLCLKGREEYPLGIYEKIILLLLKSYTRLNNSCNPSITTIAEDLNISVVSVKRHIKNLVGNNIIRVEKTFKGVIENNTYILNKNYVDDSYRAGISKILADAPTPLTRENDGYLIDPLEENDGYLIEIWTNNENSRVSQRAVAGISKSRGGYLKEPVIKTHLKTHLKTCKNLLKQQFKDKVVEMKLDYFDEIEKLSTDHQVGCFATNQDASHPDNSIEVSSLQKRNEELQKEIEELKLDADAKAIQEEIKEQLESIKSVVPKTQVGTAIDYFKSELKEIQETAGTNIYNVFFDYGDDEVAIKRKKAYKHFLGTINTSNENFQKFINQFGIDGILVLSNFMEERWYHFEKDGSFKLHDIGAFVNFEHLKKEYYEYVTRLKEKQEFGLCDYLGSFRDYCKSIPSKASKLPPNARGNTKVEL